MLPCSPLLVLSATVWCLLIQRVYFSIIVFSFTLVTIRVVHLMEHIWIPDWYSNGGLNTELPFEYQTSEYRISKSSLFRCFRYLDVRYSDPHCIRKFAWEGEKCQQKIIFSTERHTNQSKHKITLTWDFGIWCDLVNTIPGLCWISRVGTEDIQGVC